MARPKLYPDGTEWARAPLTPSAQRKVEAYMRRHGLPRPVALAEMLERFVEKRAGRREG